MVPVPVHGSHVHHIEQVGGASGRCVPRSQFSRRLSFEDVPTGGSVIVIGPQRDMLAVAHSLMEFFVDESCGQCTPCRLGNPKLLEGIEMLIDGACSAEYLSDLRALSNTMQIASSAVWDRAAPSPSARSSRISGTRSWADTGPACPSGTPLAFLRR